MTTEVFSKRLREARLAAGLTQAALGIAAGIDEFSASPRINQYERGKHLPDPLTVSRIAAVLGVLPPYFFTEDDLLAELIRCWVDMPHTERHSLLDQAKSALDLPDREKKMAAQSGHGKVTRDG